MRTTWNGSISFGLVNIPVGLAPATKPAARQSDVSFRLLHRECMTPIKQKRWCPVHDREVGAGRDRQGLGGVEGRVRHRRGRRPRGDRARLDDSRAIEITRFVPLDEVDPVYFDRTYFLVPGGAAAQRRPYVLLLQAMQGDGHGCDRPVRARRQARSSASSARGARRLALETMYLAEDVYSQAEIEEAVGETEVKKTSSSSRARSSTAWSRTSSPTELTSDYRSDLRALLEAKLNGEEIARPEPAPRSAGRRPDGGARRASRRAKTQARSAAKATEAARRAPRRRRRAAARTA